MKYPDIDKIYQTMPLDKVPWNIEIPSDLFVDLVQEKKILPCKTIDLGCGAGNLAVFVLSERR